MWSHDVVPRRADSVFVCRNVSSKWHFGGFRRWFSNINNIKPWQIGLNPVLSRRILEICRKLKCLWSANSSSTMIESMQPEFGMQGLQFKSLLKIHSFTSLFIRYILKRRSKLKGFTFGRSSRKTLWRSDHRLCLSTKRPSVRGGGIERERERGFFLFSSRVTLTNILLALLLVAFLHIGTKLHR